MYKTITMVLLVSSLLSFTKVTTAQTYSGSSKYKVQMSPTLMGAVAGGSFIALGILTKPDLRWVPDQTSYNTTFYGQRGHWRKEYVWESPTKTAAIISGIIIMGLSFTLNF